MRIGVLTGGGDCPGLNAVIRAVVRKGVREYGHEFVGFRDGWKGPLEGITMPLTIETTRGILPRGGTILGSSRTNPFKIEGGVEAGCGCGRPRAQGGRDEHAHPCHCQAQCGPCAPAVPQPQQQREHQQRGYFINLILYACILSKSDSSFLNTTSLLMIESNKISILGINFDLCPR